MRASSPVRREPVPERKVRLFGADGTFLLRISADQEDELLAAGLAEWRGRDLRMIYLDSPVRRGLDGMSVTNRETDENARGCYSYATRTLPVEGGR